MKKLLLATAVAALAGCGGSGSNSAAGASWQVSVDESSEHKHEVYTLVDSNGYKAKPSDKGINEIYFIDDVTYMAKYDNYPFGRSSSKYYYYGGEEVQVKYQAIGSNNLYWEKIRIDESGVENSFYRLYTADTGRTFKYVDSVAGYHCDYIVSSDTFDCVYFEDNRKFAELQNVSAWFTFPAWNIAGEGDEQDYATMAHKSITEQLSD